MEVSGQLPMTLYPEGTVPGTHCIRRMDEPQRQYGLYVKEKNLLYQSLHRTLGHQARSLVDKPTEFHAHNSQVRFLVPVVVTVKITFLWDVISCSLVDSHQHFGGQKGELF
jgi:hypothetical protein